MLFAAFVYLLFFALLELAAGLAGVAPRIEQADPFRGFSGLVSVFERAGDHYRTRPANTKFTFNQQSFLADKPENALRIFGLGGSSSFGFPWGADAAFLSILGEALAEQHPELHVEAVNASGTSYAMHRLNLVADELLRYEPDVFVVYSGHNEFVEPAFFDALKRRSDAGNRFEYWLSHSRFYSALRGVVDRWKREPAPEREFGVDVKREEVRVYSEAEKRAIEREYRYRLDRMVRIAQAAGAKVVLVTVPANLSEWRPEASTTEDISAEDRAKWSEAFREGVAAQQAGRFEAAASAFERAANRAPGHAETQYRLGESHASLGRFEEAARAFDLAADADVSPIRRTSGINEAIRDVAAERHALLVDADRIFREIAANGLVGFDLIEDYVHPTREGHEIIAWHVLRAIEASGWLGEGTVADRKLFDRIVANRRVQPLEKNATWFYNQAVVLEEQGRIDEAIAKYREALEVLPGYEAALLNLGYLLTQTRQDVEAVRVLGTLVAANPQLTAVGAYVNLGNALQNLGRFEEAAEQYRRALALSPDLAIIHTNLGNALSNLGRYAEALAKYERAAAIWPEDAVNQHFWGRALAELGRHAEATLRYRTALRFQPGYADAHVDWGLALVALGRREEAASHYRAALRLEPDHAKARQALSVVWAEGAGRR